MRGTEVLGEVVSRVEDMSRECHDLAVPVRDFQFNNVNSLMLDGTEIEVLPSAKRLLANRLRIPLNYLERCSEELQADNLNYWLEREQHKRDTFFCRFDGSQLRAVFTDRYKAIDNLEVLETMLFNGFSPDQEVQFILSGQMMLVKVPEYDRAFQVASNDEVIPGICIGNSEVGALAFSLESYFYRLVCTNGLIARTSAGTSRFKHISRKALECFPETLGQVIDMSRDKQGQFVMSMDTPVEDPAKTLGSFNRQFLLSKPEAEAVDRAWPKEEGGAMFHVINTYTRAAQDYALTPEESLHLEQVGGKVLGLVRGLQAAFKGH